MNIISLLEIREKIVVDMAELTSTTPYLKSFTFTQGIDTFSVLQPSLSSLKQMDARDNSS